MVVSQALCFGQGSFLQAALCPAQKLFAQQAEETKTIKTWMIHGEQVHLLANQQHGQTQAPTKTLRLGKPGGAELPHPYSLWPNICQDPKAVPALGRGTFPRSSASMRLVRVLTLPPPHQTKCDKTTHPFPPNLAAIRQGNGLRTCAGQMLT